MLEWLKELIGESYSEELDKKVSEQLASKYESKTDYDTLSEGKKDLESRLNEANKTIEDFKVLDIEGVKKSAEEWKEKAKQAEQEAGEKIAAIEFEHQISDAIRAVKGRDAIGIKANLDLEKLRSSKNQTEEIKSALEKLKSEKDYYFESPAENLSGFQPGESNVKNPGTVDFDKMTYTEMCAYMQANPGVNID